MSIKEEPFFKAERIRKHHISSDISRPVKVVLGGVKPVIPPNL